MNLEDYQVAGTLKGARVHARVRVACVACGGLWRHSELSPALGARLGAPEAWVAKMCCSVFAEVVLGRYRKSDMVVIP